MNPICVQSNFLCGGIMSDSKSEGGEHVISKRNCASVKSSETEKEGFYRPLTYKLKSLYSEMDFCGKREGECPESAYCDRHDITFFYRNGEKAMIATNRITQAKAQQRERLDSDALKTMQKRFMEKIVEPKRHIVTFNPESVSMDFGSDNRSEAMVVSYDEISQMWKGRGPLIGESPVVGMLKKEMKSDLSNAVYGAQPGSFDLYANSNQYGSVFSWIKNYINQPKMGFNKDGTRAEQPETYLDRVNNEIKNIEATLTGFDANIKQLEENLRRSVDTRSIVSAQLAGLIGERNSLQAHEETKRQDAVLEQAAQIQAARKAEKEAVMAARKKAR